RVSRTVPYGSPGAGRRPAPCATGRRGPRGGAGVKLLLDENLPPQMRSELPGHDGFTVAHIGGVGVEDGHCLRPASAAGFDALVTNDRGLEYQQNLNELPLAVVVVLAAANTIEAIRPAYTELLAVLARLQPRESAKLSVP